MLYRTAQICLNGHIITKNLEHDPESTEKYCSDCGKEVIEGCLKCDESIRSNIYDPIETPPNYCRNCSSPFPWTEKILNNAIELLSLDESLSDNHKDILQSVFPDLLVDTPTTPLAVAKYKKYISSSQGFIQDGLKQIFIDIVSEAVRMSIWR